MYKIAEKEINKGLSFGARLTLALFSAFFGILILSIDWNIASIIFASFCFGISLTCLTSGRIRKFFGSLVGISLFIMAVCYIYSQVTAGPISSGSRSQPSIINSVAFMLVFGIPGIVYTIKAKFGLNGDKKSEL